MIREIPFTGISTVPSDYECQDGQSALAVNLIPEDGVLRPAAPGKTIADLEAGERAVWVHANVTWRHMITVTVKDGRQQLGWRDITKDDTGADKVGAVHIISDADRTSGVLNVSSVGNTLCVMCDDGLWYYLWRSESTGYDCLGQKPPFIELQFGLSSNLPAAWDVSSLDGVDDLTKEYKIAWRQYRAKPSDCYEASSVNGDITHITVKKDEQEGVQNNVWALINSCNAIVSKAGHFYAPFYVRYCYRMNDPGQSMVMHSAPVFMPVTMPYTYQVGLASVIYGKYTDGSGNYNRIQDDNAWHVKNLDGSPSFDYKFNTIYMRPHNVALRCLMLSAKETLEKLRTDWKDIVRSIDIFVSLPLVREDSSEKIVSATYGSRGYRLDGGNVFDNLAGEVETMSRTDTEKFGFVFDIPTKSDSAYKKQIEDNSTFYKVYSFDLQKKGNIDELMENGTLPSTTWRELDIKGQTGTLQNLATQEVMTDDYHSHNVLIPIGGGAGQVRTPMYTYNSRLNVAALGERLFGGYRPGAMVPDHVEQDNAAVWVNDIYVYLATDNGTKVVHSYGNPDSYNPQIITKLMLWTCPQYYPDSRAYKMVLKCSGGIYIEMPMRAHAALNGALTEPHLMVDKTDGLQQVTMTDPAVDDKVYMPNAIYTSEAASPFVFKASGMSAIGTGTVLGLSSAVRALSQGQFGQYPLYAFTTDGVWALTTTTQGTYNAVQPVTRDVCTDPESITQIDQAVLFVTKRGIMLISGATTQCLSEPLSGVNILNPAVLGVVRGVASAPVADIEVRDFADWVQGCRMLYDYPRQRIIAYKACTGYAYVYSLKSKQWGMMQDDTTYGLNSYPDAWAVRVVGDKSQLVNVSQRGAGSWESVLVTRPLKLGDLNALKTVRAVITRGFFRHSHVRSVLVGSRDLMHWSVVWSSETHVMRGFSGTPYKYYRLILDCRLDADESLTSCSVLVEPRMANRLR